MKTCLYALLLICFNASEMVASVPAMKRSNSDGALPIMRVIQPLNSSMKKVSRLMEVHSKDLIEHNGYIEEQKNKENIFIAQQQAQIRAHDKYCLLQNSAIIAYPIAAIIKPTSWVPSNIRNSVAPWFPPFVKEHSDLIVTQFIVSSLAKKNLVEGFKDGAVTALIFLSKDVVEACMQHSSFKDDVVRMQNNPFVNWLVYTVVFTSVRNSFSKVHQEVYD